MRGERHGGNLRRFPAELDFSANINPLGMPDSVRRAAEAAIRDAVRYPDLCLTDLRETLGRYFSVPPQWIVPGNGAAELIYAAAACMRGRRAVLAEPAFSEYVLACRAAGCPVRSVRLQENAGFRFTEETGAALSALVRANAGAVVFLGSPNNPTGGTVPREEILRILQAAEAEAGAEAENAAGAESVIRAETRMGTEASAAAAGTDTGEKTKAAVRAVSKAEAQTEADAGTAEGAGTATGAETEKEAGSEAAVKTTEVVSDADSGFRRCRVIVDESFLPFLPDSAEKSMLPFLAEHPGLSVIRSFTKLYGMPGLRLGCLITADKTFRRRLRELLPPWNVSVPAIAAGIAATAEQAFVGRTQALVREERAFLSTALAARGCTVYPGEANFLLFRAAPDLQERLLKNGVLIRSFADFPDLSEGYFRIAVRTHEENAELLRRWPM